jgi:hypothetical protein
MIQPNLLLGKVPADILDTMLLQYLVDIIMLMVLKVMALILDTMMHLKLLLLQAVLLHGNPLLLLLLQERTG